MSGPHPTPSVIKLLRNNPGRRPINPREPQPGALSPNTPRELTDPVARAEWKRTIAPAIRTGQITAADRLLALAHCELAATWQSQLIVAAKHAHVVTTGKMHHPIPNPARVMANKTLQLIVKVDAELGLSPSSRTRVSVSAPVAAGGALGRFLRKADV